MSGSKSNYLSKKLIEESAGGVAYVSAAHLYVALNTSTGTQAVTGVGFQPKALIVFATQQSATGYANNGVGAFGFAASSSQRGEIDAFATNAQTSSASARDFSEAAILQMMLNA